MSCCFNFIYTFNAYSWGFYRGRRRHMSDKFSHIMAMATVKCKTHPERNTNEIFIYIHLFAFEGTKRHEIPSRSLSLLRLSSRCWKKNLLSIPTRLFFTYFWINSRALFCFNSNPSIHTLKRITIKTLMVLFFLFSSCLFHTQQKKLEKNSQTWKCTISIKHHCRHRRCWVLAWIFARVLLERPRSLIRSLQWRIHLNTHMHLRLHHNNPMSFQCPCLCRRFSTPHQW